MPWKISEVNNPKNEIGISVLDWGMSLNSGHVKNILILDILNTSQVLKDTAY